MHRAIICVDGRVQRVGFRWWAATQARELGLTGRAENLADGTVEIDIQGELEKVAAMISRTLEQPTTTARPGMVTRHTLRWLEPVPGAVTLADGGFILPGLVDAHCHIGIRRGGAPVASTDEARALAVVDRDTGVAMVEVAVCLTTDGGQPQMLRVQLPATGVPKDLTVGQLVTASDLTLMVGETNGRSWQMFRATSVTAVKS